MDGMKKAIEKLVNKEEPKDINVRFSVTLFNTDNRRLEYIAKTLDVSKQQLIEKVLKGALYDLEVALELRKEDVVAPDGEEMKAMTRDYEVAVYDVGTPIEVYLKNKR